MHIVVVGPKITPPWDSATASMGRGILQSLVYLGGHVNAVSTRVGLKRIIRNYGFIPSSVDDFEGFYGSKIKWYVVKHSSSQLLNETKLTLIASTLIHRGNVDIVLYMGIPRNMLTMYLLGKGCKALILYVFTIPSFQSLLVLKHFTVKVRKLKSKLIIFTPSLHAYRMLKINLKSQHINIIPPVIDASIFKPLNNTSSGPHSHLRLGYVGPLHTPRFPAKNIARALLLLKSRGISVSLHVRGVLRHGRRDRPYVHDIEKLFKRLLGRENVDVKIGQLSRSELNRFYNNIDVLLYLFKLSREAEIADPPLVPLEALSAGTPLIFSAGSSLDFYLEPMLGKGSVVNVANNPLDIVNAVYRLSSADREKYRREAHTYAERLFSPRSVAQRIKSVLEEAGVL